MEESNKIKRALVLSGGGSKGAFTGGMLEYMKLQMGREYELYLGTSTGSLLQILASVNDFDALKEGYTSIGLKDVYKISPFKKSSDSENVKLSWWSIFKMHFFKKQPTFGDTTNSKELVYKYLPREKFNEIREKGKIIVPCVTNLSKARNEYYPSNTVSYHDFVDWSWISTNAVPLTSIVKRGIDDDYYADGGIMEHMPIQEAINMGATEIDAISSKPEHWDGNEDIDFGRNPLSLLQHVIEVMMWESTKRDIDVAKFEAKDKDVTLNIYYAPRKLTSNPMYFDRDVMTGWWDEGYNYMKDMHVCNKVACKSIVIKAKKSKKKKK